MSRHTVTATYDGTTGILPSTPAHAALRVVKQKTRATVKLVRKSVRAGKKVALRIKVGGRVGGAFPTGKVTITLKVGHHKVTRTVTLHKRDKGAVRVKVKTTRQHGAASVKVHYRGDHDYRASTSTKHGLRVRYGSARVLVRGRFRGHGFFLSVTIGVPFATLVSFIEGQ